MPLSPALPKATTLPLKVALPGPRARKRRWPVVLALLALGGIAAVVPEVPLPAALAPSTPDMHHATMPPAEVVGLARLMPEGDLIRVAPPHGAGDARVAAVHVAVGDRVAAGALLATLDNLPTLDAARLAAEAQVAQREAGVEQTLETVRIARLETQAALAEAQIAAAATEARRARAEALAERGITSTAALDDLTALAAQAHQAVARARASLARWDTDAGLHPDVRVATRALEAALIDLDRARSDLSRTEVRAPLDGTILDIALRPGERPGSAGVATLGQTDRMVAQVEVFQTEIGRIRIGQPVTLAAAALDAPLTGAVARVGLLVGRQNMISDDTAANTDARVVEVIVRLDADSSARAANLSNLEALARIQVGDAP
ncbi:MAG: HlyD family efflux transporter periplasmic adaptor subunit [Rhodobacteraceae bacterium]|nr:HlyD family efflux transporter periplasmic adaptor subunit [Paracoccaceae bacterium]